MFALVLSRRIREKRRKNEKMRKETKNSEKEKIIIKRRTKNKKKRKKDENSSDPIYTNPIKNLPKKHRARHDKYRLAWASKVSSEDHGPWFLSAGIVFVEDLVLVPLGVTSGKDFPWSHKPVSLNGRLGQFPEGPKIKKMRRFWEGFRGRGSQKGSENGGLLWVLQ